MMRIAIINWSNRKVGGIETYLNAIVAELSRAGHEIAFCSEVDEPAERIRIELPEGSPTWCVAEMGAKHALAALRDWHPDVIYVHKLTDSDLEDKVLHLAPSVFFAHDYSGTCISGTKTFKFPIVQPCSRRFGWKCLVHYFPHRCGGLNPVTMLKLYTLQSKRLENLRSYDAIVTHSDHMIAELMKHGLSPQRAYRFPPVQTSSANEKSAGQSPETIVASSQRLKASEQQSVSDQSGMKANLNLLFSGRMEYLKGGHVFIDALPEVAATLDKPLRVTFAGDGRERRAWERQAAGVRSSNVEIEFAGWVKQTEMEELLRACDLLVVPSLWPEPFGLVGPEAGQFGVPVAAFDVGGIPDWLSDGVNGYLASGSPATSRGLAQAIVKCLQDPTTHRRLRKGAIEVARRFNIKNHLTALLEVFANVAAHQ